MAKTNKTYCTAQTTSIMEVMIESVTKMGVATKMLRFL